MNESVFKVGIELLGQSKIAWVSGRTNFPIFCTPPPLLPSTTGANGLRCLARIGVGGAGVGHRTNLSFALFFSGKKSLVSGDNIGL